MKRTRSSEPGVVQQQVQTPPRRKVRFWIIVVLLPILGFGGYHLSGELWAWRHWNRARESLHDGDFQQALGHLDKCLDHWPNDAEVHLLLARAHRLTGNQAKAIQHIRASEGARGNVEQIALESKLLDATTGKLEKVEPTLRQHLQEGHSDKRYIRDALIRGCLARQRNDEAEQLATLWIEEEPANWQPWLLRGIARNQASRLLLSTAFDQAKRDYERVLEIQPNQDLARFLLGHAFVLTGQFREALPHLERFVQLKPDDAQGIEELAGCYRALSQVEEARRVLDDWLTSHVGTAEVFLVRGQVAMDQGRAEQALEFYRRAEALAPANDKTHFLLAAALRALGRTEEAAGYEEKWRAREELKNRLKSLEQAAAKEPQNVTVRFEAATVALRLGDEATGLQWFQDTLKLNPKHRETHEALAEHFKRKGNLQAEAFHRRLAADSPR